MKLAVASATAAAAVILLVLSAATAVLLLLLPAAVAAEIIFNAPVLKGLLCGVYIVDHAREEGHVWQVTINVPRTITGIKSPDILKSHKRMSIQCMMIKSEQHY